MTTPPETIRVLRVIEYVGPRADVEKTIAGSIHGTRHVKPGFTINASTIGAYPEVMQNPAMDQKQFEEMTKRIAELEDRLGIQKFYGGEQ